MLAANSTDMLLIHQDGAALIGISGREVASVPGLAEVTLMAERGPYAVVSWRGRIGYVLTDCLQRVEVVRDQPRTAGESVAALTDLGPKWSVGRQLLFRALSLAAGASTLAVYLAL